MLRALVSGSLYFIIVFAFGFLFGAIREIYVVKHIGPVLSRLLEAPLTLCISWVVASWLVRRFQVSSDDVVRLAMGGLAFGLLMAFEAILGVYGFGQTLRGHIGEYATPKGVTGLAAQVMFGFIPWIMAKPHGDLNVTK